MSHLTIYEVAKKANVSIATISRAMNPDTRSKVAPETLERIDTLVAKHGFTPSLAARHLSRSKFKTLGVLLPHHAGILAEDYYAKILCGVSDALLDSEYKLKIIMLKCDKPQWDKYNFQSGEAIDGLIVTHWHAFFSDKTSLEKIGVPVVVISDIERHVRAHFVSGDHASGGRLAAEHLYAQGHRRIGVLTGPENSMDSRLRLRGFKHYLEERGIMLEDRQILCAEFQEDKAYQLTEPFWKQNKNLTAIFSLNDGMAFGFLKKMNELGLRCPEDVSVAGYDDDKRAEFFTPPLTTIRVPLYELAKKASELLLNHLSRPKPKKKDNLSDPFFYGETRMPVELIKRQSVRKLR